MALFERLGWRSIRSDHLLSSTEDVPAESRALSTNAQLCARCKRALRRNAFKVRAGRARARNARRDERGRFL